MRVIITGGTGLIGRPLSAALVADAHDVTVLTRDPEKVKDMPAGVKLVAWDGQSAHGWGELADGAGAIVNLAGENLSGGRWTKEMKQKIRQSRTRAGKAVMEAIAAAAVKPEVLVQSSAVGYYGTATGDKPVTEAEPAGNDFLAKVCFDWEHSTAGASHLGIRRPLLRTGVVLANEGGAFPKLLLPFKFFAGGPMGSGKQWLPWIHIEDEVRAIQFALSNEEADGPLNLSAPNPVTNSEIAKKLGEIMGRPSFVPAPGFALQTVLGEMAVLVLEGQRAVPAKLQALGFQFKYATIEPALRQLLAKPAEAGETGAPTRQPQQQQAPQLQTQLSQPEQPVQQSEPEKQPEQTEKAST
jgi:uncharacterized protein (TIGR01777 family)